LTYSSNAIKVEEPKMIYSWADEKIPRSNILMHDSQSQIQVVNNSAMLL
jgi:hypothetical protein